MSFDFDIVDEYLDAESLCILQEEMTSDRFNWNLSTKVEDRALDMLFPNIALWNWQLCNVMYANGRPLTPEYDLILPLVNRIAPRALIRVKANLVPITETRKEYQFHTDLHPEGFEGAKTSIFYGNRNGGYTSIRDEITGFQRDVESRENRLLTFPQEVMHRGTSCTNTSNRIVINLNYF